MNHRNDWLGHRHTLGPVSLGDALHELAAALMAADDRAWFDTHPAEAARWRPARDHEFCDPEHFPGCVLAFEPPPPQRGVQSTLMVEVHRVGPGMRTREPYWVLEPEEAA